MLLYVIQAFITALGDTDKYDPCLTDEEIMLEGS